MMKSIKEKAEEYGKNWYRGKGIPLDRCRGCYAHVFSSYEAGANYVLEHLSMTIAVSEDSYLRDNLKIMIEQLKK